MEVSVESLIRRSNMAKESGRYFEALDYAQRAYRLCAYEELTCMNLSSGPPE